MWVSTKNCRTVQQAIEIAETDRISASNICRHCVHMFGLISSISKNKIFESVMWFRNEQAKIIMNENVDKNIDTEELASKLNISYSWFESIQGIHRLCSCQILSALKLVKPNIACEHSTVCKGNCIQLGYNSTEHSLASLRKIRIYAVEYRSFSRETKNSHYCLKCGFQNLCSHSCTSATHIFTFFKAEANI
jgi:hypothetical protein